jgi:hypothetical protein
MANQIPDLWPQSIDVKVLPPIALLRYQASQLPQHTQGILEAEVATSVEKKSESSRVIHDFRIVAPALEGYTYGLFQAWHDKDFVYPVSVRFDPWVKEAHAEYYESNGPIITSRGAAPADLPTGVKSASTPAAFLALLGELLASSHTQSVLVSLIARINDADPAVELPAGGNGPEGTSGGTGSAEPRTAI